MSGTPYKMLPCPFCGGPAEIFSAFPRADNPEWSWSHESEYSDCPAEGTKGRFKKPEYAAAAWNARLGGSSDA